MLHIERANGSRKVTWWTLFGLLMVPIIVVGGLFAVVHPSTSQVRAAVVNLDKAVKIDDQLVPLGRQLSAEIVKQQDNITWTLADLQTAEQGLISGDYSAVVVIPETFSEAATSFSANNAAKARQATVEVRVGKNSPVSDTVIAQQIARVAADLTNTMLTENYLDNIYLGFNAVGEQFVSISDGARELSNGIGQANTGISSAADGAGQLSEGMSKFAESMPQLADGVKTLASNGGTYIDGVGQFSDGSLKLVDGVGQLGAGLRTFEQKVRSSSADYSELTRLRSGSASLASGATGLSGGLGKASDVLKQMSTGTVPPPKEVTDAFKCPVPDEQTCKMLLRAYIGGFQGGTGTAWAVLNTPDPASGASLVKGANELAGGAGQFRDGIDSFVTELPKQAAAQQKELADGIGQVAQGAESIVAGAKPLSAAAAELKSGGQQFKAGLTTLSDNVRQLPQAANSLSDGAKGLANGLVEARDGMAKLNSGADTFATKLAEGKQQVPHYSDADRSTLKKVVTRPIAPDTSLPKGSQSSVVAVLLAVGLWLGAMACYLVLRTVPSRVVTSSRPTWQLAWAALAPGMIWAGIQAILLGIPAGISLGLSFGTTAALVAVLVLAGAAFVAVNHAAVGWFGGWGRLLFLGLAVFSASAALTSGIPETLSWLTMLSPLTPALQGIRGLSSGANIAGAVGVLLVWLTLGLVFGCVAIMRRRQLKAASSIAVPVA